MWCSSHSEVTAPCIHQDIQLGKEEKTGRLMSTVGPSLLCPEKEAVEQEAATSGSCTKSKHQSSTVQTEQELLAQHGPASAPKSTGRCHGAGEQQQQHRVHRFPLPGEQICWHSQGKDRAAPADPCAR